MTYVPATDKLTLNVNSDEPAGGIFAHLVNLPGLPPAKFASTARGRSTISTPSSTSRPAPTSGRKATSSSRGRARGGSSPSTSTPGSRAWRPRSSARSSPARRRSRATLVFNDDSTIATPGLHLVSANARLDIEGGRSADNTLDIKIHAGAIPGATEIGKLDLDASIVGPIAEPDDRRRVRRGRHPCRRRLARRVSGDVPRRPSGAADRERRESLFEAQAAMSGLALADPALASAVGSEAKLSLRGSASPGGDVAFDTLDLVVARSRRALFRPARAEEGARPAGGHGTRPQPLCGARRRQRSRAKRASTADLDGAPRYGALNATIDAHATQTRHRLSDPRPGDRRRARGDRRRAHDAGRRLRLLRPRGESARTARRRLNGDYRQATRSNVERAAIDMPQAKALDPRVAGKAEVVASLTGAPDDLGAEAEGDARRGPAARPQDVGRHARGRGGPHHRALEASAQLSGDIDGQPLQGSAHVAKRADGGWTLDNLALSLASASLSGGVTIGADHIVDRRPGLQREEPRRSLAPRADQAGRRASGEGRRVGRRRQAGGRDRRRRATG